MLHHYYVANYKNEYAKQKQPGAVKKKGTAKQSRIKSIEALYVVVLYIRARARPVAK